LNSIYAKDPVTGKPNEKEGISMTQTYDL